MEFKKEIDKLFNELIQAQQKKVLTSARIKIPHLTTEDILNPHDFPELIVDPIFNYEDGVATGLMSAWIAIRAHLSNDTL